MGYVSFKHMPPIMVAANTNRVNDPLSGMMEAVRIFELTQGMPCQEGTSLSSMSEDEFVAKFGG